MNERDPSRSHITIEMWDANGPEFSDGIASFAIIDPTDPNKERLYCIGCRHLGGQLSDPSKWEYDHTNLFHDDNIEPQRVTREELDVLLETSGSTFEELLFQYCNRL